MEVKKGKRELILEAAINVFSTKGYHNTRMEEIASQAGVGKGTIYEYFSSKLHLFQEMMEESIKFYTEKLIIINDDKIPFTEKIFWLLEGHIRFCKEYKELTRIVFWDIEIFDDELKEWALTMRKHKENYLNELVKKGIESEEIRPIDSRLVVYYIAGIIEYLWTPITLEDWDVDSAELAREFTDIIINGIGV